MAKRIMKSYEMIPDGSNKNILLFTRSFTTLKRASWISKQKSWSRSRHLWLLVARVASKAMWSKR